MTDAEFNDVGRAAREHAFAGRSGAYRWLQRRHRQVAHLLRTEDPPWATIATQLAAMGIRGGRGKPLTADAVRQIWKTVCRDVAADTRPPQARSGKPGWRPTPAEASPTPMPSQPPRPGPTRSRLPLPATPPAVTPAPRTPTCATPPLPGPPLTAPPTPPGSPSSADAKLAKIQRELDERSGRW
jgi:hypothetical protein